MLGGDEVAGDSATEVGGTGGTRKNDVREQTMSTLRRWPALHLW